MEDLTKDAMRETKRMALNKLVKFSKRKFGEKIVSRKDKNFSDETFPLILTAFGYIKKNLNTSLEDAEWMIRFAEAGAKVIDNYFYPDDRIEWYESAALAAKQLNRNNEEMKFELALGQTLSEIGRMSDALLHYNRVQSLVSSLTNESSQLRIQALNEMAVAYNRLGKQEEFFSAIRELEAIDPDNMGIIINQASFYAGFGQYLKAIEFARQGISKGSVYNDRRALIISHAILAYVLSQLGENLEEALDSYTFALDAYRADGNLQQYANVLGNSGVIHTAMNNYAEAIRIHKKAANLCRKLDDRLGEAINESNLGKNYILIGKYKKAEEHTLVALKIAEDFPDAQGMKTTWIDNLGIVYTNLEDFDKALKMFDQCIEISTAINHEANRARALMNKLEILIKMDQLDTGLEIIQEALPIIKETGEKELESACYGYYATLLLRQRNYPKAIEINNHAIAIAKSISDKYRESQQVSLAAQIDAAVGNLDKAVENYEVALKMLMDLSLPIPEAELRVEFSKLLIGRNPLAAKEQLDIAATIYKKQRLSKKSSEVKKKLKELAQILKGSSTKHA